MFPLRLSLVGGPLPSSHLVTAATTGSLASPRSFPGAFHGAFLTLGRLISHHWWLWSLGDGGTCRSGGYGARGRISTPGGTVGSNGSLRLLRCRWCEELDWFGSTIGEFDGGVNSGASTNLVGQSTEFFTIYRFGPSTI